MTKLNKVDQLKADAAAQRNGDSRYKAGASGITRYSRWLARRKPRRVTTDE